MSTDDSLGLLINDLTVKDHQICIYLDNVGRFFFLGEVTD